MRLQGKVAIVTGAALGMGLAIATLFAAEGIAVLAGDWNEERLNGAVRNIQSSGDTITGVQGNIADKAAAEGLVELALSPCWLLYSSGRRK